MATLETEWGKLAAEKARDIKLRDFGKGVAKDQTEIKVLLNAIVVVKGLKLPTALPIKEQERLSEKQISARKVLQII